MDMERIAALFEGWDEALIWSCLQGCMGYALADREEDPTAAQIVVGDLCFFAGKPNAALIARAGAPILTPRAEDWHAVIESVWGARVERTLRYAIKKEPDAFDPARLAGFAGALPEGYTLQLFDRELYDAAIAEDWSRDFCSLFAGYDDFAMRGVGVGALYEGGLVSGASSYGVYDGGIEIQIDTHPAHRRKGLASACGARLILECLARGLYPSWDAHDLRSVALAEKLGYHLDHPYTVYALKDGLTPPAD